MPLGGIKPTVRISLLEEKPADYRCTVADGVHSAMRNLSPGRLQPCAKLSSLDDQ